MNNNLERIAILTDYLLQYIPENNKSKELFKEWLKTSSYSPYITLYGGVNSLTYDDTNSFTSSLDNLKRYKIHDEFTFKLENFTNFGNEILSANTTLDNVITSKELFKAYPDFRNINISINISKNNKGFESGSNYYNLNKIEIFTDNTLNAMKVLLHELQHSIQIEEGFLLGASYYNEDGVMDAVKSLAQKEKRGVYNVQYNNKSSTPLYSDLDNRNNGNVSFSKGKSNHYLNPQGKRVENGFGAKHIRKHLKSNRDGWVYAKELLDIGEVLRNQEPIYTSDKKRIYEFSNDKGIKFRLISLEDKNIVSFYSYRKKGISEENSMSKSYSFQDHYKKENIIDVSSTKKRRGAEFNHWFSNSHVVDNSNNPLVVYHGGFNDVEEFNTDINLSNNLYFGSGSYFTSSHEDANKYSNKDISVNLDILLKAEDMQYKKEISYKEAKENIIKGNEQIYPVFLSIKNPLIVGKKTISSSIKNVETSMALAHVENSNFKAKVFVFLDDLSRAGITKDSGDYYNNIYDNCYSLNPERLDRLIRSNDYNLHKLQLDLITPQGIKELMILENRDGIIYHNVSDNFKWLEKSSTHYLTRTPEQIKSIHNNGNFSINSSNILEKNDLGLRFIEKALSIIPSGLNTQIVKEYLLFNDITHETLKGTLYQDVLNSQSHINIFDEKELDTNKINTQSDYYNSGGEIESREIEELYMNFNF